MSGICRISQLFHQYAQQTVVQNSFSKHISKRLSFMGSSDDLRQGTWHFPLHQSDCHAFGMAKDGHMAHGGVIGTIIEDATTVHICANDTRDRQAVTTDLNLTFLGLGKVGRTLVVDSNILKIGANLGVAEAKITDLESGKLIAVGRNTMMFVGKEGSASKFSASISSTYDV